MITFPLWFKIFLGWGVFSIIWQTYLLLTKDKYIAKIKRLPDEKKEKKIKGNSQAIKAFKLFFLGHTSLSNISALPILHLRIRRIISLFRYDNYHVRSHNRRVFNQQKYCS
jgi:hypothetical protein